MKCELRWATNGGGSAVLQYRSGESEEWMTVPIVKIGEDEMDKACYNSFDIDMRPEEQ